MDHKWFSDVARRLRELEAERAHRYAPRKPELRDYLFCHPTITHSILWNAGDTMVNSECFDWDSEAFWRTYVLQLSALDEAFVMRLAMRPYVDDTNHRYENTRTLLARVMTLGLEDVLEAYDAMSNMSSC